MSDDARIAALEARVVELSRSIGVLGHVVDVHTDKISDIEDSIENGEIGKRTALIVKPLYRAPLRHIGGKNYAPYETSAGDTLIAVVQPDGGSWLTYSFTNWNAISSSLQHVELHSQAVSSVPVYGIFERVQA